MAQTSGLEAAVQVEGLPVRLHVRAGRLHVDGPFAGNIEVVVASLPILPPRLILESLAVRTSADSNFVTAMAYESFPDGRLEVTYHSHKGAHAVPLPDTLTVVWGLKRGQRLGTLPLQPVRE